MPWKRPRCIDTSVGYCGVLEEGRAPSGLRECVRQGVFVVEVIITLPLAAQKRRHGFASHKRGVYRVRKGGGEFRPPASKARPNTAVF